MISENIVPVWLSVLLTVEGGPFSVTVGYRFLVLIFFSILDHLFLIFIS